MDLKELYQEIILDHKNCNKGKCDGYNHDAKAHNPYVRQSSYLCKIR